MISRKIVLLLLLILNTGYLFSGINLDSGCVANYMFSGNANDISGYGNNGTVYGASLTTDRFGNPSSAYFFNGVNDYISAPNTPSLRIESSITLSAWIKTSEPQPNSGYPDYGYGEILGLHCTNGSRCFQLSASKEYNYVGMTIDKVGSSDSKALLEELFYKCNLFNNIWHFIIGTYDYETGYFKFYVDNNLVSSKFCGSFYLFQLDYLPLTIGCYHIPGPCRIGRCYFKGCIDDIRLYSRAINDDEVTALYQYPQAFTDHGTDLSAILSSNSPLCEGSTLYLKADGDSTLEYSWTGPNGFSAKSQNPVINNLSKSQHEGKYKLSVTNHDTCSIKSYTLDIKINETPDLKISGRDTICEGEDTYLYATDGYTKYKWSTGETSRRINVNQSGNYSVSITDSNGCTATESINFVVVPNPSVLIYNSASSLCEGDSALLSASFGYQDYEWFEEKTNKKVGDGNNIFVKKSGRYYVKVKNKNLCEGISNIIEIEFGKFLEVKINSSKNIFCEGDSAIITSDGNYTGMEWFDASTNQRVAVDKNPLVVYKSGRYYLHIKNGNKCDGVSDTINVEVKPKPVVTLKADKIAICEGDSVLLTATGGFVTYEWHNVYFNGVIDEGKSSIYVKGLGWYSVVVRNEFGCEAQSQEIEIKVEPKPDIQIDLSKSPVCEGDSVTITISGNYNSSQWYDYETNVSVAENINKLVLKKSGKYYIKVKNENGCEDSSGIISVDIKPKPQVEINVTGDVICEGDSVLLSATGGFTSYKWYNDDTNDLINEANPIYVKKSGKYFVKVQNEFGCETQSKIININVKPKAEIKVALTQSPVCEGDSVTITISGNYNSSQWYDYETNVLVAENINKLILKKSGKYYIKVKNENSCEDSSGIISVGIIPKPQVDINITGEVICEGDSMLLSATSGFSNYEWYNDDTNENIEGNKSSVYVKKSGKYKVKVSSDAGCEAEKEVDVIIKPKGIINFNMGSVSKLTFDSVYYGAAICKELEIRNSSEDTIITNNFPLRINVNFSIPQSIFPLTLLPNESKMIKICFQPDSIGYFEDEISIGNECGYSKLKLEGTCIANNYFMQSNCDVGIKLNTSELKKKQILFSQPYPNPANDKVFISFTKTEGDNNIHNCSLYSLLGVEIKKASITIISLRKLDDLNVIDGFYEFDTLDLQNGYYIINFISETINTNFSVIIKR